jgi:tetratricopeptide (TPR) repeat protein
LEYPTVEILDIGCSFVDRVGECSLISRALLIAFLAACAIPHSIAAGQASRAPSPRTFSQLFQAAEKARDENRLDDAIRLFRRALAQQPESEQALWFLGTLLYEKEQYAEARDVLRQFVTLRPDAGPAWAFAGLSEFQLREYPRALDHLQRAMAVGMGDRKELVQAVFYHVAVLLTRAERFDDSMDMLRKMLVSGPPDPELVETAGLAGLRMPFLPPEIPPDLRELVNLAGQAVLAMQTQHYEEADSKFQKLVSAYPNEPGVHFLYGAYLTQLHPNESAPEFERELEISPSHVLARVRLAEHRIAQRDFDRALLLVRQAMKLEPKRASAHMLAGEALLAMGNAGEGVKELESAREDDPSVSRTHWDLLRAYAAAGRREDAEREKQEIEKLQNAKSPGRLGESGDNTHDQDVPK